MKKTAIIFMAIMTLAMAASGKVMRRTLGIFQSKVPETETIAPETMEFVYDYSWCNDTTGQLKTTTQQTRCFCRSAPTVSPNSPATRILQ